MVRTRSVARFSLSLVLGFAALGSGVASADRPTIVLGPRLTHVAVVSAERDGTLPAGTPIALRLGGLGRCAVDVAVRPADPRLRVRPYIQSVEGVLGTRETFTLGYRMPAYAEGGPAVAVRVTPRAPCAGEAAEVLVRTERPRLVVIPIPAPSSSAAPQSQQPQQPPQAPPASSSSPAVPPAGAPAIPGAKPANGTVTSLSVPDGSFAEDEAQRLAVKGTGGCGLDLHVSNKSYGGTFDKTFAVAPLNLANGSTMYNGTHFDTLAEGSYHADVTGKNGCTGTAGIDFKVTAKTSTAKVTGKPTVVLDKQPLSGSAFKKSKDSNIWFKVSVPQSFKDANASCCDVEYDYMNAYGGWEPLPNSPFNDAGLNPLANANSAVPKSVSYFTVPNEGATRWRMRVRGYRYKTTFEWSDWLEFSVDQN
jgi:hypothetical protein